MNNPVNILFEDENVFDKWDDGIGLFSDKRESSAKILKEKGVVFVLSCESDSDPDWQLEEEEWEIPLSAIEVLSLNWIIIESNWLFITWLRLL